MVVKFSNPWIDPRVLQVRVADAEAYLLGHGWKPTPYRQPQARLFEGPAADDGEPVVQVLPASEQLPEYPQRIVDLITALAILEHRYAGDVLSDILRQQADGSAASANGGDRVSDVAKTTG